jgi:succinyl-diaminopimelate desuccinylase
MNQAAIPTVICGPGSLTVAHSANESVPVTDLVDGARAYARMFAAFLA